MSWSKYTYKDSYNRALIKESAEREDQQEAGSLYYERFYDLDQMRQYYGDETYPTINDYRVGCLLTVLLKLKLRSPKKVLSQLYW